MTKEERIKIIEQIVLELRFIVNYGEQVTSINIDNSLEIAEKIEEKIIEMFNLE